MLASLIVVAIQIVGSATLGLSKSGSLVSNLCQSAASLLAFLAACGAARRASGPLRQAWSMVATGIAIWTVSNISWTYYQNFIGVLVPNDSLTNFGFIVFRIPFGLALMAEAEKQPKPVFPRLLDSFQFLLLAVVIYVEVCYLPQFNPLWQAQLPGELMDISMVSNLFLLTAFPLRSLYAGTVGFRRFCRTMAVFVLIFFAVDSVQILSGAGWYTPSGTWYGLAFSLPFIVGAIVIDNWRADIAPVSAKADTPTRIALASVATSMVPALVPILLLILGAAVEEKDRTLAIVLSCASLGAFGLRFVLVQSEQDRSRVRMAELVEQLKESNESFRSLFLSNPLPMWVYSRTSLAFLAVNDAAVEKYGYRRDEFLRMTVLDIRPEEDKSKFLDQCDNRDFQPATTWRHKLKSGEVIDVEITAHRLVFGDQDSELIVSVDVSERLRTQRALEASEKLYRSMFEDAPFGLYRAHERGEHFISVNAALVTLLGYDSKEELLSVAVSGDVYTKPEDRVDFRRKVKLFGSTHTEVEWVRKGGEHIHVRLTGRAIESDNKDGSLIFEVAVEDVTETRHLQERLLHAQKMESVGTLAGGVAHDFNNILMITSAYSEMLESQLDDRPNLKTCALEIRKAVDRASTITSQLLAFSRKQAVNPIVLNASVEIAELQPMLKRLCGENIEIEVTPRNEFAYIEIDRGQFAQVLLNLAANARDAMPPGGGKITIKTRVEQSTVLVVFADSGTGIDDAIRAKVFEPFFTTKDVGKGTGLGLATVYGIVKAANGEIEVDSRIGEGTTFVLRFPLAAGSQLADLNAKLASGTSAKGTILIVDDEGSLCSAISSYLESKGHVVYVARSGSEALRIARELSQVDVLLSDVAMPGMRGPELAAAFRPLHPKAHIVLMTGYAQSGDTTEIPAEVELLVKPITLAELDQRIQTLMTSTVQ